MCESEVGHAHVLMHVCLPPSYLRFTKLNGKDPTRKDISQLSSAEEAGKVADFFLAWNKANRGGNIASGGKAHVVTSKPSSCLPENKPQEGSAGCQGQLQERERGQGGRGLGGLQHRRT